MDKKILFLDISQENYCKQVFKIFPCRSFALNIAAVPNSIQAWTKRL